MDAQTQQVVELRAQERLRRRLSGRKPPEKEPVDETPCCVYGLVTRKSLECLQSDVDEIKGRVNALLWSFAGTVLLEVLLRMTGH